MKKIAVMGSTGSIGTQTLDIVRQCRDIRVCGLSAGKNKDLLEKQAREFLPELIVIENEADAGILRTRLCDTRIKVSSGQSGLLELAQMEEADIFVAAIVGMKGIRPTLSAIKSGKDIALANKETLVTAGHLITARAKSSNVRIIPVDSEHSAVLQCIEGSVKIDGRYPVRKIWITSSGGAFRGKKAKDLINVTVDEALNHPNWKMGRKVTIDSATLVNKGLEVIEAYWLFDLPVDRINVIVQPKSIIHAMVEFDDGAVMAQIGPPDMHIPIQYAITDSARLPLKTKSLDFALLKEITFEEPDTDTFRGLPLALEALNEGGTMLTAFNAANEAAVGKFLDGKIKFLNIFDIIEASMAAHRTIYMPNLDEILQAEEETRAFVEHRW